MVGGGVKLHLLQPVMIDRDQLSWISPPLIIDWPGMFIICSINCRSSPAMLDRFGKSAEKYSLR